MCAYHNGGGSHVPPHAAAGGDAACLHHPPPAPAASSAARHAQLQHQAAPSPPGMKDSSADDDDEDYGNEDEDGHVYHRAHHHHQQQHNSGRLGKRGRGEDSGVAEDNAGGKRVRAVVSVEQSAVVQQLKSELAAATADPHGAGCGGPVLAGVGRGASAPGMEEMGVRKWE